MKKNALFLFLILMSCSVYEYSSAQVGINTDGSSPDGSSMLDVKSTNKGLLLPRMSITQAFSIPSPAAGLMVYNTTSNQPIYFDGSVWRNLNGTASTIAVGTSLEGGIVFYVDNTGESGLIATTTDQSTGTEYGCYLLSAERKAIGTGNQNTIDLATRVPACCLICDPTNPPAANICYDLVLNGYDDWFLPSKDELNLMYQNLKLNGQGGFANTLYWSSSSIDHQDGRAAWCQNFSSGSVSYSITTYPLLVRAVRSFGNYSAPDIILQAANSFSDSAKLNAKVNANGYTTTVTFEYGTSTAYGSSATATQSPLSGHTTFDVSTTITGLTLNTTYHYRVKAENQAGITYGSDQTFIAFYGVGESYAGGIVFYVDETWLHGLVASPTSIGGSDWGCNGTAISGADGTAIGTGNQNTTDIVNGCDSSNCAAKLCYNLVLNGYNDWFLPSKDELTQLVNNLYGPYYQERILSSSEYDQNSAWGYCYWQIFCLSGFAIVPKTDLPYSVYAVRTY